MNLCHSSCKEEIIERLRQSQHMLYVDLPGLELNSIFLRRYLNCFHYSLLSNFGPQCLINIRQ